MIRETFNNLIGNGNTIKGPGYAEIKTEGLHIALIVVLFMIAMVGIRVAMTSTSPTSKAVVAIIVSMLVFAFTLVAIYFHII